MKKKKKKRGC